MSEQLELVPRRCSCGAPIVFARTKRGGQMPLDPEPNASGNVELEFGLGEKPLAIVHGTPAKREAALARGAVLWMPHFENCPHAARHRRRKYEAGE